MCGAAIGRFRARWDWTALPAESPIFILLATYDGERYIEQLLDSIRAQHGVEWRLLVRDDGSTDSTPAVLARAAAADRRICLVDSPGGRLGSTGNFFALMQHALARGASHFALCDQDDVWAADKLATMRHAVAALEGSEPNGVPILAWSDLEWIDARGRCLAASHFRRVGARAALAGGGAWLLAMNVVPGCAMFGNRALLELAAPQPRGVAHHDWWLALVAAAIGRTIVVDRPLVKYRQHGTNIVGAEPVSSRLLGAIADPVMALGRARASYWQAVANAQALREIGAHSPLADGWAAVTEHAVTELGAASRWRRAGAVVRGPVRRLGAIRNALMLVAALADGASTRWERAL